MKYAVRLVLTTGFMILVIQSSPLIRNVHLKGTRLQGTSGYKELISIPQC